MSVLLQGIGWMFGLIGVGLMFCMPGVLETLRSIFAHDGADAQYWRRAYEDLVHQTGRDLNDGFGVDPRKAAHFTPSSKGEPI
jgi:hypothetical protein